MTSESEKALQPPVSKIRWERQEQKLAGTQYVHLGYVGSAPLFLLYGKRTYELQFDAIHLIEGPFDSVIEAQQAAELVLVEFLADTGLTWKDQD